LYSEHHIDSGQILGYILMRRALQESRKGVPMSFKKFWVNKSYVAQVIYIVIIVYCACSINVLLFALGAVRIFPNANLVTEALTFFTLISFLLALCTSVFHIRSIVKRDKRRSDKLSTESADV
jgi:hypothetical protein